MEHYSALPEAVTWPTNNSQAMAASRPLPSSSGSIIRGPDPGAGPIHCVIQDNLADDCFHARFMYWAAYDRYFSSNYDQFGDRNMCPMLGCRIEFSDLKSMLDHLRDCPHAGKGEYWCWKCWRAERFPLTSCVAKRSFRSRSRSLIGSVRKAFSSPLTRSIRRKHSNTHQELPHSEPPPPMEKTQFLPPHYGDTGILFPELAAHCNPSELDADSAWEMPAGATPPLKPHADDSLRTYLYTEEDLAMGRLPPRAGCFNSPQYSRSMPTTDEPSLRTPSRENEESRSPGRASLVSPMTLTSTSLWTGNSDPMPITQEEPGRVTDADWCQSPGGLDSHDEQFPDDMWATTSRSGGSSRTQSTDDQQPPTPGKDFSYEAQMPADDFGPFLSLPANLNDDIFPPFSTYGKEWQHRFSENQMPPVSADHPSNLESSIAPTPRLAFESSRTVAFLLPVKRKPLPGTTVAQGPSRPFSTARNTSWNSAATTIESPPFSVSLRKDPDSWQKSRQTEAVPNAQPGFPHFLKRTKARKMRSRQEAVSLKNYVKCSICGHEPRCKPELLKRSMERHLETHAENREYFKCEYLLKDHTLCQRSFSRPDNLLQHQKRDRHENEHPRKRRKIASSRGRAGMNVWDMSAQPAEGDHRTAEGAPAPYCDP